MEELQTLVIYDIPDDRIRTRISEACLDYGLDRFQFSSFRGRLSRNKRQELFMRLRTELGSSPGKVLVQPLCDKDVQAAASAENRDAHVAGAGGGA